MSTERQTGDAAEGELFIRDLSSATDEEDYDEEEGDGIVTTMMVGEEGERGMDRAGSEEGIVTTLAIGEEGDRAGEG